MTSEVCLIISYYGSFPFWMPAFYLSCKHNPSITWLIFTDTSQPDYLPDNVQFINLSLADLNALIRHKLKIEVTINSQYFYKLCDFKPAYGLIFQDYLKNYGYWGHCDLDIVWGDIESFLIKENLPAYDIFTTRINKISGHCCLYRNTSEVNELFKKIRRLEFWLKKVDQYCGVDEKLLSKLLLERTNPNTIRRWLQGLSKRNTFTPKIYWDKILAPPGKYQRLLWGHDNLGFTWKDGKTYHIDGEELMYIHFHKLKHNMKKIDFDFLDNPSEFLIKNKGVYSR